MHLQVMNVFANLFKNVTNALKDKQQEEEMISIECYMHL